MNDKLLITLAFAGSVLGIFLLFIFSTNMSIDKTTIEKINNERIDSMVKLEGEVVSANSNGNITFLSVRQPGYLDVVLFSNSTIESGDFVEIIGQTEEYNSEMEIIAHRIRLIES